MYLAVLVTIVAILFSLWILVPAFYGLPPIASRRKRILRALHMANLQPGEALYDLGAGHGRVLIAGVKEFDAYAIGIEAGPIQCLIARLNATFNGVNSNVTIQMKNLFDADLSNADVVYVYLTSQYAQRLQKKFENELKHGARVVTVAFNLPDWQPVDVDKDLLIYLYLKG